METTTIKVDPDAARDLYHQYRDHKHYSTAVDREIQRAYRLISQGKVVIRALESIKAAGIGADGLPKLAILPAHLPTCFLSMSQDGSATFASDQWGRYKSADRLFSFPAGTFPTRQGFWKRAQSMAPMIPIHLRPRQALDSYHLLWEAIWTPAPPGDPVLLRRIGHADLWLVVAAWDLTDVELAALSTRVST